MPKENIEKLIEIKRKLDEILADKEAEIETLKKLSEEVNELVTGVSFVSAADIIGGSFAPLASTKGQSELNEDESDDKDSTSTEDSSAQWEKYIYDESGGLLAKLVYFAGKATIVITHPEDLKLEKSSPLFQDFFIEKFLIRLKEQTPNLTLDFEETVSGYLRQITIAHVDSDENFAKIEQAIEHVIKRGLREAT
ncbi:MAG TPA: hypothetical protein VKK79_19595 [Candidatus Lokiarchaeia archaeon]|nr:hypothetical protein [Candidatus Lokiarchaeia archaeon]